MADAYERLQREHWSDADQARFDWVTRDPVLAPREAELAAFVHVGPRDRLLEIGCGEGANLHHLRGSGARFFGVDFSRARARFARDAVAAETMTADARALPFAEAAFDHVLIRDLLHHVDDGMAVLAEARRVLRPGGRLTLIEPNRNSPLVLAQAAMIPAERGVLRSTAGRLRALVEAAGLTVTRESQAHPFPIERVMLHPELGASSFSALPGVARLFSAADALARRLLPARIWMYLLFEAIRPEHA